MDPLCELIDGIIRSGKPSLEWLVRHSANGLDPVKDAWNRSKDPCRMLALLKIATKITGDVKWKRALRKARKRITKTRLLLRRSTSHEAVSMADLCAVREAVPVPPTLQDMLKSLHGPDC